MLFIPVFGLIFVLAVTLWVGYHVLHGTAILSPLPEKLGKILPAVTTPSEKQVMSLLSKQHIMYTSVYATGGSYSIKLNETQEVILSSKKDLSEQISSLQIMLPRLTMEEKQFKRLDLRYDKPVVVY